MLPKRVNTNYQRPYFSPQNNSRTGDHGLELYTIKDSLKKGITIKYDRNKFLLR